MPATSALEKNFNSVFSLVKKLFLFLPSVCIALAILVGSLVQSPDKLPLPSFNGWDKVVHAVMYLVLAAALQNDLRKASINGIKAIITTALFCPLYGGLMEWLQARLTLSRSADVWDWIADCVGTCAGIIIVHILWKNHRKETTC